MTSCTIIIYHFESIEFLKACVRKIRQYKHYEIEQHILITEQSSDECYNKVMEEFSGDGDITIVRMAHLWSGYSLDYCLRYCDIKTDYVCGIEPDVFPIHKNWLYICIKLLEEFNLKFVGGLIAVSKPEDKIFYYNNPFYWLSQFLRVGRTTDYRELALEGGFTRYHNRTTKFHNKIEMDKPMTWGNDDWERWAKEDYYNRGSDDGTVAHCWEDNHRENNKFSFGVSHILGVPDEEIGYGRVVDEIVFHFAFHGTSVGAEETMGERYCKWKERINNGCTDELIDEMLGAAISTNGMPKTEGSLYYSCVERRTMWDGKLKVCVPVPQEINNRIEQFKKV